MMSQLNADRMIGDCAQISYFDARLVNLTGAGDSRHLISLIAHWIDSYAAYGSVGAKSYALCCPPRLRGRDDVFLYAW